jgi:PAS domain S-box-containing protein
VKSLDDGKSHEKELVYQTKEGEKIFLNRTNILNRKPDGSPELILMAAQDITSLRESKEQLEINEKKYKSLFNNAGHPVMIIDIDSQKIVDFNKTTQKLLGYKSEELVNQKVEKIFLIDPELKEKHLNTLISNGKNHFRGKIINKDGNIKEAFIMAELLVLKDHRYVQVVLGFSDELFHKNFKKL